MSGGGALSTAGVYPIHTLSESPIQKITPFHWSNVNAEEAVNF